jgi:hypothetical protein
MSTDSWSMAAPSRTSAFSYRSGSTASAALAIGAGRFSPSPCSVLVTRISGAPRRKVSVAA